MNLITTWIAGLAVTACATLAAQAQETAEVDVNTVLATVGDTEITLAHVIALRAELPASYDAYSPTELYQGLLEQLIIQTGLVADVDTDKKRVQLALENQRRSTLASAALDQHLKTAVTDEQVAAVYEREVLNAPKGFEFNASHILVATEEEATAIADDIRAGADFAETAIAKSTGPTGPNGGNLGWFGAGQMVPEFDQAVALMDVGAVSEPVLTQFGWHVIKLNEKRELAPPSLEQAGPEIRSRLALEAEDAYIEAIRASTSDARAEVEIDPALVNRIDLLN